MDTTDWRMADGCAANKGREFNNIASATSARNEAVATMYKGVKDRVSNFAESSKALMIALEEVGNIHPFIQGA